MARVIHSDAAMIGEVDQIALDLLLAGHIDAQEAELVRHTCSLARIVLHKRAVTAAGVRRFRAKTTGRGE